MTDVRPTLAEWLSHLLAEQASVTAASTDGYVSLSGEVYLSIRDLDGGPEPGNYLVIVRAES